MPVTRTDPPYELPEREMLVSWLDYHRATLALKCDGLSDDQLRRRSVPPSGMSLLGLVRHMAEVELNWFRRCLGGEDAPGRYWSDDNPDGDFDDVDDADVAEAFEFWRSEIAYADDVLETYASMDDRMREPSERRPDLTVRWVLVHMIEEYARHNGHADFLREVIDGATGD